MSLEVTPFRARVQAESGQWTDASLVRINMDESNFFAPYVSGNAYVADFAQPTSTLHLPITVPAAVTASACRATANSANDATVRPMTRTVFTIRLGLPFIYFDILARAPN